jgi:outer membrane receptor for ferrienterochelin and colicin
LLVRYATYETLELRNVVVRPSETTTVTAALQPAGAKTRKVTVTAQRITNTTTSELDRKRNDEAIIDGISSEQIARSTDSNAAEAVSRVTGATIEDGKYVFVRGLGERYTSAQVNGANIGTPEANKRVLPLDVFPTALLDRIEVRKTYTPDMDGQFGGALVNIRTKDFHDQRVMSHAVSFGASKGGVDGSFLGYGGGNTDFLGFDDGTRRLPTTIDAIAGTQPVTRLGFTPEQLSEMGRSFRNTWTPERTGAQPDFGYNGMYSDKVSVAGRDLGFVFGASLSNTFSSVEKQTNQYGGTPAEPITMAEYEVEESKAEALSGLTGTLHYQLAKNSLVKAEVLYTKEAEDRAWISEGPNEDTQNLRQTQLAYVERGLLAAMLKGEHELIYEGSKVDWILSYSQASRDELDRRLSRYEWNVTTQQHELSRRSTHPLTRIFGESTEWDRSFKANWLLPMDAMGAVHPSFKAGFSFSYRNRNAWFRRFGFTCRGSRCGDRGLLPEELITAANLDAGNYWLEELTKPNDAWWARHTLTAAYGMFDVRVFQDVRSVFGVRFEQSEQIVETRSPFFNDAPETVTLSGSDALPAANVTWSVTPKQNLRVAWSQTLARPELRELSSQPMFNYEEFYEEEGNPQLQDTKIESWDVRWELFPGVQEYVGLSAFHKDFKWPIQRGLSVAVTGERMIPINGEDADLTGAEIEVVAGLGRLWNVMGMEAPSAMRHWGLSANYTRVKSLVRFAGFESPFQGQASYAWNAGLSFSSDRVQSALAYHNSGPTLRAFTSGELGDLYVYPMQGLDFNLGVAFMSSLRLKFQAENLLNEPIEHRQGDLITRRWLPGRKIGLSLQYRS